MATKKETKTSKKKAPAPQPDTVEIETIKVPENLIGEDVAEPEVSEEEIEKANEAEAAVKASQEKLNDVIKEGNAEKIKEAAEEELAKMEELKGKVESMIPQKYTSLWNGINFNL